MQKPPSGTDISPPGRRFNHDDRACDPTAGSTQFTHNLSRCFNGNLRAIRQDRPVTPRLRTPVYRAKVTHRAGLPLLHQSLRFTSGPNRIHRRQSGSSRRALNRGEHVAQGAGTSRGHRFFSLLSRHSQKPPIDWPHSFGRILHTGSESTRTRNVTPFRRVNTTQ